MRETSLFGEATDQDETSRKAVRSTKPSGPAKLLRAERSQILLMPTDLEALLPEDHVARGMWALVGKLELTRFLAAIDSREDEAGRPAIDPRILVTLWIYGTSEGVASARELARLCRMHDAYRWICGGVAACAHTLSDFRVDHRLPRGNGRRRTASTASTGHSRSFRKHRQPKGLPRSVKKRGFQRPIPRRG